MKTKTVIDSLLNGTISSDICRICLEKAEYMAEYDEPQTFLSNFYSESHELGEIIAELTKKTFRVNELDIPMRICECCVGNAVSAFLFIKQFEVATQSLISCVEQLQSHVEKINATDIVSMSDECIVFVMPYENMYDLIEKDDSKVHREKELDSNPNINIGNSKNEDQLILKDSNSANVAPSVESFQKMENGNDLCELKDFFDETEAKLECKMCTLKFPEKFNLNLHEKWHEEEVHLSCKICGSILSSLDALEAHSISHRVRTKDYLCTECGKSFYKKSVLNAHLTFHGEKKYNCVTCGKSFYTNTLLRNHKRLSHEPKISSICDLCGKMCPSNERLKIHRESHVTKICPYCGKNLFYKRTYKNHVLRCSGVLPQPEAIYECDYCGGTWRSKQQLRIHIFGKHVYYKPFRCDICDKGFYSKNLLKGHSIVHTRERLWVCDICSNRFVDKKALKVHRRLHTGEKPYECEVCGERFICPTRRIMHIRRKHMARSLACDICGLMFHTNSNLTAHYKRVHYTLKKKKSELGIVENINSNNDHTLFKPSC